MPKCQLCGSLAKSRCQECGEWSCAIHHCKHQDICVCCMAIGSELEYAPTLTKQDKNDSEAFYMLQERGSTLDQIAQIAKTPVGRVKALIEAHEEGAYKNVTVK